MKYTTVGTQTLCHLMLIPFLFGMDTLMNQTTGEKENEQIQRIVRNNMASVSDNIRNELIVVGLC